MSLMRQDEQKYVLLMRLDDILPQNVFAFILRTTWFHLSTGAKVEINVPTLFSFYSTSLNNTTAPLQSGNKLIHVQCRINF